MATIIAAVLLAGCERSESTTESNAANEPRGTPVTAVEVMPRDLSRMLSASGTVAPRVRIRLASRAAGTVDQVHVEVGDAVEAGDILAELDVSEERAELERARAQAEEAQVDYDRAAELRERGVVSPADYQRALARLRVANSEQLLWQTRVDFGRVAAPRRSVVTARYIEPGEAVQAQDTLFQLSAMDTLVIRLGVSELDVGHLQPGQPVPLQLDALPGEEFDARIRRIYPSAEPESRLVIVEIALPEDAAERNVRPGYLGRVRMAIDARPDTLAVPAAAVGQNDAKRYVYVISGNRLEHREVEIGVTRGDWTEILQGLARDEVVLATNPIDRQDGEAVRIVGWRG
ncbi:MAG: efflux RND transporter periplasmic adaptor subunit [Ectothiorhodospiraceae bacterium]|nr:efflux RND transporter periplasmic adaptor subunit [Ectothiorhodospiraceae bacterium]